MPILLWLMERIARRHRLVVFALQQEPAGHTYTLRGATVHNFGLPPHLRLHRVPGLGFVSTLQKLLKSFRSYPRFDVVHGFWAENPGLLATLVAKINRAPSVISVLGGELIAIEEIGYGGQRRLRGRAKIAATLRAATLVTTATDDLGRRVTKLGIQSQRLPLGVDRTLFSPPEHRDDGPPYRLLSVGSLNRVKDHRTQLEAGNVEGVLEGDLDRFIRATLMQRASGATDQVSGAAKKGHRQEPA